MKKFMVLYMATPEQIDEWMSMPKEGQGSEMREWTSWMESKKDMFTDKGTPLGQNLQVKRSGITPMRNGVCGYSVIQADDHQTAAASVSDCPHLKADGAWIDVVTFVDM